MTKKNKPSIVTIVGPTATGKTDLALFLAQELNGEIVSADSRQIYRRLDLGTGKAGKIEPNISSPVFSSIYPTARYLELVPQWLIDIVDPEVKFTVVDFQIRANLIINDILERGKLPIITGGTGLYVTALTEGYQFSPETARHNLNQRHSIGLTKKIPPSWNLIEIGLDLPKEELQLKIKQRLTDRINNGMVEEGKELLSSGVSAEWLHSIGLEYRYLVELIQGQLDLNQFETQLASAIYHYAKRQLTWWRHHGQVNWFHPNDRPAIQQKIVRDILK